MHRTNLVPRSALGWMVLSVALGDLGAVGRLTADEIPGSFAAPPAMAPFGGGQPGMPGLTGAAFQEQAPPPRPQPGAATPAQVVTVGIGASKTVQMRGGLPIRTILNSREDVATIATLPTDRSSIVVTGRQAGSTFLTLTADNPERTTEVLEIHVQLDVEFLRTLLVQAAPGANIQLIPIGSAGGITSLIVSGTVSNPEDINIIMKVADSIVGRNNTINAMHAAGVQQVQLDVVIAQVSRTELRNMNFDFIEEGAAHVLNSSPGAAATTASFTQAAGSPITFNNIFGNPNGQQSNIFFSLFNDKQQFFGFLQILRNENLAKLLAEPRLVCLSGRSAQFLAGGQQAVPSPGGLGAVSVQFVPFGTQLNFMPVVLGNGKIFLEVAPSVSALDQASGVVINGFAVQGRTTQQVHTQIVMEDGQTFVIGGLIQHAVSGSTTKVPILGDLPFIGAAFSRKSYSEQEQEVIVMVTPHLVDPLSCAQVPKVLPGQETRSPDDFELFLEGILEAPRGPRQVSPNRVYKPAYMNGPSSQQFPCAPSWLQNVNGGGAGACGAGCGTSGMGLADGSSVSYPGVTPALTQDKAAPAKPVADTTAAPAERTSAAEAGSAAKPVTSPSLFGPAGDTWQK